MNEDLKILKNYLGTGLLGREWAGSSDYCLFGINENNAIWKPNYTTHKKPLSSLPARTDCKPLLLPLSALTEPMKDGSVPLIEIAKIIHEKKDCNLVDYSLMDGIGGYFGVWCDWGINFETNTIYYPEINCFIAKVNGKQVTQFYQLQLFEWLFEHHFNVYNLPEDKFIDKRTLNLKK